MFFGDFQQVQTKAQKKIIEINREIVKAERELIVATDNFLADKSKANRIKHEKTAHHYRGLVGTLNNWIEMDNIFMKYHKQEQK